MPTIKMTARSIEALRAPASGRIEFFDASLPGFGIRLSASGRRTWIVLYRHKGRLRRMTLGNELTLADARDQAKEALRSAEKGRDPAGERKAERLAETFAELAAEYIERYAKPRKRSWRKDEAVIDNDLLPRWRNVKAKDIGPPDVHRVLDAIVDRGSPIQANRTFEVIRKLFNWAVSKRIVDVSPCRGISKPAPENRRDRVLNEQEIRDVWTAIDAEGEVIAATFKFRFLTAQRGGEILPMRWDEIDEEGGWWTIPAERSKNKLSHRVPLTKDALALLASLKPNDETARNAEWVFPSPTTNGPISSIWKASARIVKASRVDFDPHDIRRTVASHLASAGVSRVVLGKLLNHAEKGVTAVYDRHGYDAEKRAALEAWANRLAVILSASNNVVELKRA